jgi:hypothetical protein
MIRIFVQSYHMAHVLQCQFQASPAYSAFPPCGTSSTRCSDGNKETTTAHLTHFSFFTSCIYPLNQKQCCGAVNISYGSGSSSYTNICRICFYFKEVQKIKISHFSATKLFSIKFLQVFDKIVRIRSRNS